MKKFAAFFVSVFTFVFGRISWQAPPWAVFVDRFRKSRPRTYYGVLILIVCLAIIGIGVYQYYKSLPQPNLIVAKATLDEIRSPSEEKVPAEPLFISFSRQRPQGQNPAISAGRLDLAGKRLTTGVTINPAIDGTWEWENDLKIKFTPKDYWPAGQDYTVVVSPEILQKEITLYDDTVHFQTAPFKASFVNGPSLYTDPRNRSAHQAVATVVFTHLIDEKTLRDGISLVIATQDGTDMPVSYSVTVDKTGRRAHILSDPFKIEPYEQFMRIALGKGIRTVQGNTGLSDTLLGKLQIPTISSFFHVKKMDALIIPNQKKDPEQTITVDFSDAILRRNLEGNIKVWLLPPKNPERNNERWTSASQINPEILGQASELPLKLAEIVGESSERFGLVFDAPENREIYMKIEAGIASESGFQLTKPYDAVFCTPIYPKEAKILGHGGIMASSGNKILSIQTRGLNAIKIRLRRLLPQQLQHLVSQTGGDITSPYFHCYSFNEANISEPFEKMIPLSPKDPKTPVYARLDLTEFLDPEMQKPGVFFVEILGWDPKTNHTVSLTRERMTDGRDTEPPNKRTIIITDLAILIKNATDRGRDIFVESVGTGSPADGAEVLIVGRNGETLQSGKTNADGHVAFPPLGDATDRGREPFFCTVKKGADLTFLPFDRHQRQLDMSKFDTAGVYTRYMDKNQLNAFVFSDRGIYRPGETVHLGFLFRSKGFAIPAGIPLELHISDPRASLLVKKNIALPEGGFFDLDFPTTAASATGSHRAEIYLVSEKGSTDRMIGSATFKVEEFEPDRLRMSSTLSDTAAGWAIPENLSAAVTLKNLFGAPAQNRKVTGKIILQPMGFRFDRYPGVVFTDPLLDKDGPLKEIIQEIEPHKTDNDGKTTLDLDLVRFEKGTYKLVLNLEGYDEGGGKGVRASNTILVSPMQSIVGYKADGDLAFIRQGVERKVIFIGLDRELAAQPMEKLSLRKVKIMTISALVRHDNGTYGYQSAKKEEQVWERPFSIPETGQELLVETGEAGDYAFEIKDPSGTVVCRAPYSVAGESNITAEIEKAAELSIELSQTTIRPGQALEFQITTPYKGAGLVTVETDRVYAFKWFKTDSLTTIESIRVPEHLEGNAYLCVALVRSIDDPEIFTSPLSYAAASFSIDRARRELIPEIRVPDKVAPGEKMEISYRAARSCKIVVFAVDEGILQFAGYKTPAPLDHFLKKLALEVSTSQTADLILPEYNLLIQRMGIGGDADAAALRSRHLNPFARKNNTPAVFWSGIVDAGPQEQTLSWETPDTFNGEVRVMAVAADGQGMGSAEKSAIVRGPFVVNPVLPLAVTPGDDFTMTVGIANVYKGSGKAYPVTLSVDPGKGFAFETDAVKKFAIDEDGEATAVFSVKTIGAPGETSIRFRAESGEVKAQTSASVSIRPPTPLMTTLTSGVADSGTVDLTVKRRIIPEFSGQKVSVSASPLVLAVGLESWLNEFPYGCTEQLLSRGFPALAYAAYPGDSYAKEKAAEKVQAAVSMLRERQRSDGGFAMWPGGPTSDFASIYSLHFLTDAGQAGFSAPKDMIDRGIAYLRKKAGEKASGPAAWLRAYSIYLLTRNEIVTSNYLIDLEKDLGKDEAWKEEITSSFMAASYRILKQDNLAWALFGRYKPAVQKDVDDLCLCLGAGEGIDLYLTARHFPEASKKIKEERIMKMVAPVLNGSFHTFEAAWTILALSAWTNYETLDSISISERSEKGEGRPLQLTFDPFPSASFATTAAGLEIKAGRRIFYTLSQTGFDRDMPKTEIRDGLEIIREFKPARERSDSLIRPGDDITVVLKIRALDGRQVGNVAVTDMFAGCFSPDIPSIRKNSQLSCIDYIDVREDRAVFYGSFDGRITELPYQLRVTAPGEFIVPPAFAESLYNTRIKARSLPGTIKVEE